jgi:hypothetical protein
MVNILSLPERRLDEGIAFVDTFDAELDDVIWGLPYGVGFGFSGVVVVDAGFGGLGRVI